MSRGAQQRILSQLSSSPNELSSGIAQCIEALRLISALPRAYPLMVEYTGASRPPVTKAFGRTLLSRLPLRICWQAVVSMIKTSMNLPDHVRVASATFYREDGSVDTTRVLLDEDSWKELVPYIHTLHVEGEQLFAVSPAMPNKGLSTSAKTFVPSATPISIKTEDGTSLNLRTVYSPNSPPPSSPFAMLDKNL
ncbi:hypothetical protein EDC04DRAFT_1225623 [Pisolithus marmoratus]|nr:hypothetical protein EDC04DRAFT_1225623 [Pisolithus marmoratus]